LIFNKIETDRACIVIVSLLLSALILSANAERITTTVGTNNTDWSIRPSRDSLVRFFNAFARALMARSLLMLLLSSQPMHFLL